MNQNASISIIKRKIQNCNQIFYRIFYHNTCKEEKSIQHVNACLASRTVTV